MLDSYTLIGTAIIASIPIGYLNRKIIKKKLLEILSLGTDAYVELKWKYVNKSVTSTPILLDNTCESTKKYDIFNGYKYKDKEYLTLGDIPTIESIEGLLCEDESVSSVILNVKNGCSALNQSETNEMENLMFKLAGPLCDFHENSLSLNQIKHISNGIAEKLDSVIVNTEYFKEFVLN